MQQNIGRLLHKKRHPLLEKIYSKLLISEKLQTNLEANILQRVESILNRNGYAFNNFENILEFGCRYGRLTKYLFHLAPKAKIFGCDIEGDEVGKCKARLPKGNFYKTDVMPPLPFADKQFDFIFSYSVFTHLSEKTHQIWLKELARVLKRGGVMIHTIHSLACLERLRKFSPESISKYNFKDGIDRFMESPSPYYYTMDNPKMSEYGLTVMLPEYILENWPKITGLKVLGD